MIPSSLMELTRRQVLAGAAVSMAMTIVGTETARAAVDGPEGLPAGVEAQRAIFENWDGTIRTPGLWTVTPRSSEELLAVANWAVASGWTLRPQGARHSWSPLTVDASASSRDRVLLLDMTRGFTHMEMTGTDLITGAGAMMDAVMPFLHRNGRGFANIPAPGDVTIGGVLAVGAHGTSIPARGETPAEGAVFGSLSNAVVAMEAVVWDGDKNAFVLAEIWRDDPRASALLVNLGRIVLTRVRLRTQKGQNWRCRNRSDIRSADLFAAPAEAGSRSLSALIDEAGRVGVIWYSFSEYPWVQRWDVTPRRPLLSRPTFSSYNYPFADRLPSAATSLIDDVVSGHESVVPLFGEIVSAATMTGLTATGARDMWGPAYHFQHFVRPTTLRVMAASHALVIPRARLQDVVHRFATHVRSLSASYAKRGRYPFNSCMEIRVTGVDDPTAVGIDGAQAPALSAAAPDPNHPDRDTVVWLDLLSIAGTRDTAPFFAAVERFLVEEFSTIGTLRPEWAKRFAHTDVGAWTDTDALHRRIPESLPGFAHAQEVFRDLDPHAVFTSTLLDALHLAS